MKLLKRGKVTCELCNDVLKVPKINSVADYFQNKITFLKSNICSCGHTVIRSGKNDVLIQSGKYQEWH